MAIDLHKSGYQVVAADRDPELLERLGTRHGIRVEATEINPGTIPALVRDADLVVGATPGFMGFRTMESVIRAGKHMVDISFCPEDFMALDPLAREHGVVVVADMGVAPGMCNALLGYHYPQMQVKAYRCLVGGLPFQREWPLQYKSAWSPMDCIEEYVRPARMRENGKEVVKPALSDSEIIEFDGIGELEAWNSDGLRSLLTSFPQIPHMVEKTLRYPGTVEYLRVLRELGYFSNETILVQGKEVRPVDVTAALLFPLFELEEGEGEFTVMRVEIEGVQGEQQVRHIYDLYDTYDESTGIHSMARTTGYAATGAAGLILSGRLTTPGVVPPEMTCTTDAHFRFMMDHLKQRGVHYRHTCVI